MRDGYVIAGWVATLAGIGMYAYRTVIRARQVASRLLALQLPVDDLGGSPAADPA